MPASQTRTRRNTAGRSESVSVLKLQATSIHTHTYTLPPSSTSNSYVDYFKCINARGDEFAPWKQFYRAYHSLCPSESHPLVPSPLVIHRQTDRKADHCPITSRHITSFFLPSTDEWVSKTSLAPSILRRRRHISHSTFLSPLPLTDCKVGRTARERRFPTQPQPIREHLGNLIKSGTGPQQSHITLSRVSTDETIDQSPASSLTRVCMTNDDEGEGVSNWMSQQTFASHSITRR